MFLLGVRLALLPLKSRWRRLGEMLASFTGSMEFISLVVRVLRWYRGSRVTWEISSVQDVVMGLVDTKDAVDEEEFAQLEDVDGDSTRIPNVVRKYVSRLQLKFGLLERCRSNELMIRNRLDKWFEEDSVRYKDRVAYVDQIIELTFVPSNTMVSARLVVTASRAAQFRSDLYSKLGPKESK